MKQFLLQTKSIIIDIEEYETCVRIQIYNAQNRKSMFTAQTQNLSIAYAHIEAFFKTLKDGAELVKDLIT